MTAIKNVIEADDIEWQMDWSGLKQDGSRLFPDKPETEMVFERKGALAMLLLNNVLTLNSHWWEDEWPKEARDTLFLGVDCSDVFAWGCSDSEGAGYKDIESVYRMWRKDPIWGPSIWTMIKRREMPQRPVEKKIREAGVWDLDVLRTEHDLRANHYDGLSGVAARQKYEAYTAWERSRGQEPRPYDAKWWDGWREFIAENPDWWNDAWKAEEARRRTDWKVANGYVVEDPLQENVDVKEVVRRLGNMLKTASEHRDNARNAGNEQARTFNVEQASSIERGVIDQLPALLRHIV